MKSSWEKHGLFGEVENEITFLSASKTIKFSHDLLEKCKNEKDVNISASVKLFSLYIFPFLSGIISRKSIKNWKSQLFRKKVKVL